MLKGALMTDTRWNHALNLWGSAGCLGEQLNPTIGGFYDKVFSSQRLIRLTGGPANGFNDRASATASTGHLLSYRSLPTPRPWICST